jgi:hypothetical protein
MRAALNFALITTGVLISAMAAADKTIAVTRAEPEAYNAAVIHGLHLALPGGMKTFPAELVPLP